MDAGIGITNFHNRNNVGVVPRTGRQSGDA
jgi:hypothetical protein